jgi:hypothetical protein
VTHPPYRHAAVIIAVASVMASLLALSYSLALSRPKPHHIPAAVIGDPATRPALVAALERATDGGLDLHPYASLADVRRAIAEQKIYAGLVLTTTPPQLLVSSAAGASVARVLGLAALQISEGPAGPLALRDTHPLPAGDPQGLVTFYVTLAATILGFVTVFQLQSHAEPESVRGWLACIAGLAVFGALLLASVVDPIIGALHGHFPELWAALAAEVAVAALFNLTMIALFGRWAIVPTWGVLIMLGNSSSGGAVAPPLLPPFYSFIHRFLPLGATVETIRNAVYFSDAQHLEPVLVEAIWLVGALVAAVLSLRRRGRR